MECTLENVLAMNEAILATLKEEELLRRDRELFGMSFQVNGRRVDPRLVRYDPEKREYLIPVAAELV